MYGLIIGNIIGSIAASGEQIRDIESCLRTRHWTSSSDDAIKMASGLMALEDKCSQVGIMDLIRNTMYADARLPSTGKASLVCAAPAGWSAQTPENAKKIGTAIVRALTDDIESIRAAESLAVAVNVAREAGKAHQTKRTIMARLKSMGILCGNAPDDNREGPSVQLERALTAFFSGKDFKEVMLNAVSLGGDTADTAAASGELAEAYYGIPSALMVSLAERLPVATLSLLDSFGMHALEGEDTFYNVLLSDLIDRLDEDANIRQTIHDVICLMDMTNKGMWLPSSCRELLDFCEVNYREEVINEDYKDDDIILKELPAKEDDGGHWMMAFTDKESAAACKIHSVIRVDVHDIFRCIRKHADFSGVIINKGKHEIRIGRDVLEKAGWYVGYNMFCAQDASYIQIHVAGLERHRPELFKGSGRLCHDIRMVKIYKIGDRTKESLLRQMRDGRSVIVPIDTDGLPDSGEEMFIRDGSLFTARELERRVLRTGFLDRKKRKLEIAIPVFTDAREYNMGPAARAMYMPLDRFFRLMLEFREDLPVLMNPWNCADSACLEKGSLRSLMSLYNDTAPSK